MLVHKLLIQNELNLLDKQIAELSKEGTLNNEFENGIKKKKAELEKLSKETFRNLKIMIWLVYILGFVLIGIAIYNYFTSENGEFGTTIFGTLGIVDILGLLFYRPIDRLQKANSDLSQHIICISAFNQITAKYKDGPIPDEKYIEYIEKILKFLKEHIE